MGDESKPDAPIPIEKPPIPPSKEADPAQKNTEHAKVSPITEPQVIPSPSSDTNSGNDNKRRHKGKRWKHVIECVFKFGEFITFLAVIITAWYIRGQWIEMERTRILDERAWVAANHVTYEGIVIRPDFKVDFRNTGKTPAIKVFAWIDCGSFPPPDWSWLKPDRTSPLAFSGLLAPDATGSISTPQIDEGTERGIEKGMPYFVYGKIWYGDIFGQQHWSEFCYEVSINESSGIFSAWPVTPHNTCDDAKTSQTNAY